MKIPLYSIIVPPLRKNSRLLRKICGGPLLIHSSVYAGILGLLGAVSYWGNFCFYTSANIIQDFSDTEHDGYNKDH